MTLVPEGFFNPSAGRIRLLHLYLPAQPHTLPLNSPLFTPLKFNNGTWKSACAKGDSFWKKGSYLGSMLNFRGVSPFLDYLSDLREELQVSGVACWEWGAERIQPQMMPYGSPPVKEIGEVGNTHDFRFQSLNLRCCLSFKNNFRILRSLTNNCSWIKSSIIWEVWNPENFGRNYFHDQFVYINVLCINSVWWQICRRLYHPASISTVLLEEAATHLVQ